MLGSRVRGTQPVTHRLGAGSALSTTPGFLPDPGARASQARDAGIEYVHVKALGSPKPNRERYRAGDIEGGAAVYRKLLSNGSRSALVELADSLGDGRACLLCFERDHTECHRDVIVEALTELQPALAVRHL